MTKQLPTEVLIAKEVTSREQFNAGKELAHTLVRSPLFQMLLFVYLVKLSERVNIGGEPLLDTFWATSLLTVGVGAKTIETMSGSIEELAEIAKAVGNLKGLPS